MRFILKKYLVITFSVFLVSSLGLGLLITGDLSGLLFSTLILTGLMLIKSFVDTLLFPINLITLNLTVWLSSVLFIFIWSVVVPEVRFVGVNFSGAVFAGISIAPMMVPYWASVVVNSLILVMLIRLFNWILK